MTTSFISLRRKVKTGRPTTIVSPAPLLLKLALFLTVGAGLTACTTAQVQTSSETADLSKPQTLTSDLFVERAGKSFKIKAETSLISPHAIRLDLLTTLDLPLASVVLQDKKLVYVLYRDKKYYSGNAGPHALDPLFPLAVDVQTLVEIFQEQKVTGADCQEESGALANCVGKVGNTAFKVAWSKRQSSGPLAGRATKIVLELPERRVSLRFYLNNWQKNVGNAERLLQLPIPSGFTPIL